jgi:hypothetical protein
MSIASALYALIHSASFSARSSGGGAAASARFTSSKSALPGGRRSAA